MKYFLFIIACSCVSVIFGQEPDKNFDHKNAFGGSYSNESLRNHGLSVIYEKYLLSVEKFKIPLSSSMMYFNESKTRNVVQFKVSIGQRFMSSSGWCFGTSIGLGYMHEFYKYDRYIIKANGSVVSKQNSEASGVLNVGLDMGYQFEKKPYYIFLRPEYYIKYPNQHTSFETSYVFHLGCLFDLMKK